MMSSKPCASSLPFIANPVHREHSFHFEQDLYSQGFKAVAGVDEAGRGPLAGPVVAGCVVLPRGIDSTSFKDSKLLKPTQREVLYEELHANGSQIGVGIADAREIERVNILQASLLAMRRAVDHCSSVDRDNMPDFLLVDGKFTIPKKIEQLALVKGETKSASIAAASIVAKVTRDRLMMKYHEEFPQYNFLKNQGYPTREHRLAIAKYGPCPLHRKTFKGVSEYLDTSGKNSVGLQQALW